MGYPMWYSGQSDGLGFGRPGFKFLLGHKQSWRSWTLTEAAMTKPFLKCLINLENTIRIVLMEHNSHS